MIVKDDVGKSKPTTRSLPKHDFAYGKPDQQTQEGASEVCTSWKVHNPRYDKETDNPRNFKLLNYKSVIAGNVTAPQNYKWRKSHDYRIPFGMSALKNSGA